MALETIFDKKTLRKHSRFLKDATTSIGGEYESFFHECIKQHPEDPKTFFLQDLPYPEPMSKKEEIMLTQQISFFQPSDEDLLTTKEDHIFTLHRNVVEARHAIHRKNPTSLINYLDNCKELIAYAQQNSINISEHPDYKKFMEYKEESERIKRLKQSETSLC